MHKDTQSEERKSFKPPFLLPCLSSRMRILLRRWTTQFLGLDEDLEEDEPNPEVLEEVAHLEAVRESGGKRNQNRKRVRKKELRHSNLLARKR